MFMGTITVAVPPVILHIHSRWLCRSAELESAQVLNTGNWYCRFIGDLWERRRRDLRTKYIERMYTLLLSS